MILLYLVGLLLAVISFLVTFKFPVKLRIIISVGIFIIIAGGATYMFSKIGDPPPKDSVEITQEELDKATGLSKEELDKLKEEMKDVVE